MLTMLLAGCSPGAPIIFLVVVLPVLAVLAGVILSIIGLRRLARYLRKRKRFLENKTMDYWMWAEPDQEKPGNFTYRVAFWSPIRGGEQHARFTSKDHLVGFYEGMGAGVQIDLPLFVGETKEIPQDPNHPNNIRIMDFVAFRQKCLNLIQHPERYPTPTQDMSGSFHLLHNLKRTY